MILINPYGGVHHGYFILRTSPDVKGASFPGLGYDGPENVALALFTFPSEKSYQDYREAVATDPECQTMAALVRETKCFTRYERLFLRAVTTERPGGCHKPSFVTAASNCYLVRGMEKVWPPKRIVSSFTSPLPSALKWISASAFFTRKVASEVGSSSVFSPEGADE